MLEGCYKIGRSADPERRLGLIVTLPVELTVHLRIGTDRAGWLERFLHVAFNHRRVRGEWFRLDEAEMQILRGIPFAQTESDLPESVIALHRLHRDCVRSIGKVGLLGTDGIPISVIRIPPAEFGLLTVEEAAEIRGVDVRTVQRWIAAGSIPAVVIGSGKRAAYLVREKDVRAFSPNAVGRPVKPLRKSRKGKSAT